MKIILWDYVDGVLLHKFELSYPICLMFHSGQDSTGFYGVLQIDAVLESMWHICHIFHTKNIQQLEMTFLCIL